MSEYIHEPITTESTTRMLILHNGAYKDELTGDLEVAELDNCPPWEALSYAWGTTSAYSSIKIGNRFIKISSNLDSALRRLRYDNNDESIGDPGVRLWVDQICIDQENIQERSEQVQLMYSIYKNAQNILVWLGPDHDKVAKKAFFTLRLIASLDNDQRRLIRRDGSEALAPLLEDLKLLFEQSWFSRLWIVQEIGTDTPAEFYWGQECITFETLHAGCKILSECLFIMAHTIDVPSWVSDWNSKTFHHALPTIGIDLAGAPGSHLLRARVIRPQDTLQIQGFVFDVVGASSRPFEATDFKLESPASGTEHILAHIWREICGHGVFDMLSGYHVLESSALVAFLDTCRAGWEPPLLFANRNSMENTAALLMPEQRIIDGISYLCQILPLVPLDPNFSSLASEDGADRWQDASEMFAGNRRFVRTKSGYYALCPGLVKVGDLIVVLMGCMTPFVLRPAGDGYLLVGDCYVHGIMQGQATSMLDEGNIVLSDFLVI
ncbi:heterokaryon incompatibility protein-domain-containing protein [Apiospora arundinis]|uniref:Heterokaryon incompatibility protein-domain-containing protein n=1 Tax=Apiospora arundinis TaxID=335852 RepID=A0ABR2HQV2_9PEZI